MPAPLHLHDHTPTSEKDLLGRLIQAVGMNRADDVNVLLDAGVDVNGMSPVGTPLLRAVQTHNVSMIDLLVQRGAALNAPGLPDGPPPIVHAVRHARVEVVRHLLNLGADPTVTGGNESPLLDVAIYRTRGAEGAIKAVVAAHQRTGTCPPADRWAQTINHQVGRGAHKVLALLSPMPAPALSVADRERIEDSWTNLCPTPDRRKVRAALDHLYLLGEQHTLKAILNEGAEGVPAPVPAGRRRL